MDIINPYFTIDEKCNIFDIRKKEYDNLEFLIAESLKPVFDLGYDITKFGIVDVSRQQIEELSRSYKKKFELVLNKNEFKIDLSMGIPELIDDNFVFINGKKKIPHFQLIDLPITTKQNKLIESSYIIKYRSNVCTTVLYEKVRKYPGFQISLMGKRFPFALLLVAYYGDKLTETFEIPDEKLDGTTMYNRLINDIKYFYDMQLDHEGYLKLLGENFTRYNVKVKGEEIIYGLNLIPQIDVITAKLMKTNVTLTDSESKQWSKEIEPSPKESGFKTTLRKIFGKKNKENTEMN